MPLLTASPAFEPEPDAGTPSAADDFGRWLLAEAGLAPAIYRMPSLQRRVAACLRALDVASVDAARDLIQKERGLLAIAIDALLIGVTGFFRDDSVTEDLRLTVIPELARRPGTLRVWSAGCSSGPELYSIAILLSEAGLLERTALTGTDCRREAIAAAASGVYDATETECVPAAMRAKYFEPCDGGWRIADSLRRSVRWKAADLWTDIEPGPWDLVLWRNVAIYLNPEAVARILSGLVAALGPGGFLVLGKAERAPADAEIVPVARSIFRKAGDIDGHP